jgi:hypothetical protein
MHVRAYCTCGHTAPMATMHAWVPCANWPYALVATMHGGAVWTGIMWLNTG